MRRNDRYLKIILTVIAVELLWIGLKEAAPGVSAQATRDATPVVITGVSADMLLPVGVVGTFRQVPVRHRTVLDPATVRVAGIVSVEAHTALKVDPVRPIKVEADRPLKVENVGYTGGQRPGD